MIYVFLGSEVNILKSRINEVINDSKISNIIKLEYGLVDFIDILNESNYVDLFGEKKLIIVSNFSFKKINEKEEEMLLKYLDNSNDNIIIFKCIDESLDSRRKFIKVINEKCKVIKCEKLDYKSLHSYISDIFKENKKKITFNQVKNILDLCEYNTDITINEVEKLLIYKGDDNLISDEDINNVISKSSDKEIFNLLKNVMQRDIASCFNSYKILKSYNIDEIVIIDSLSKQFRMLYQTKVLISDMDTFGVAKYLNTKEYTIKKLLPYIEKYDEEEIMNVLFKLSEMDSDIKLKGLDKTKVLELFFLNL